MLLDDSSDSDFDDSEIKDDITEISEFEDEFEEEAMFEESFTLPKHLKQNLKLKKRFDTLVSRIKNQEPTLEQILQLKIRPKRKSIYYSIIIYINILVTHIRKKILHEKRIKCVDRVC